MKCLITGINGFAASHLADRLLSLGHEVHGTVRIRPRFDNIAHIQVESFFTYQCDMSDPFGVEHVVKTIQPDVIFHLAAQSFVGLSWTHPEETLKTNLMGTLYLLEAVRKHAKSCRVHIASSSQVYGKNEEPMGLDTGFNPMNPYDTSKLAQDMLGLQYFNSYGLNVIRTRAFNITGPRRGDSFAESSWAKQIAEIETKGKGTIKHGNLESWRDYIDVRDVAIAYAWAGLTGTPGGLYILGSGFPTKMQSILEILKMQVMDGVHIDLQVDQSRMRPSDTPYMRSKDSVLEKIVSQTENRPLIPLEKSLKDLLNYWREKIREKNLTSIG